LAVFSWQQHIGCMAAAMPEDVQGALDHGIQLPRWWVIGKHKGGEGRGCRRLAAVALDYVKVSCGAR
jgi:hypothetical protein